MNMRPPDEERPMIHLRNSGIQTNMRGVFVREGVFLSLFCLVLSPLLMAQEDRPAPPDGNEQFVHVRFVDGNGNSVRNLHLDEITATTQDGQPLEVTRVIPPNVPYDVGLVMDVSPSTEEDVDPIRQATSDFVSYVPLESKMLVLTFANEVFVDCDWTTDRKKVDEAIWEYGLHKAGSKTILRDAVVAAAQQMFFSHRPRTVMVLFTDGADTGSDVYDEDDTIEFLQGAGVLTYVIEYFSLKFYQRLYAPNSTRNPSDPRRLPAPGGGGVPGLGGIMVGGSDRDIADIETRARYDHAVGFMRKVGDAGGGGMFNLESLDRMHEAYEEIASELLDSYTIGFRPAARATKERVRKVRIRTTRDGVLARSIKPAGYGQ
jgi:VWFA-related protein